jgi:hypothetical protein
MPERQDHAPRQGLIATMALVQEICDESSQCAAVMEEISEPACKRVPSDPEHAYFSEQGVLHRVPCALERHSAVTRITMQSRLCVSDAGDVVALSRAFPSSSIQAAMVGLSRPRSHWPNY